MKVVRYVLVIIVLAGASAGGFAFMRRGAVIPGAEAPVTQVSEGEFRVTVREVGYLKAKKTVAVNTKTRGQVTRMLREGTFVDKGDPFLWMETKDLEQRIKEHEVQVEVAKANLEKTVENNKLQEELERLSLEQANKDVAHNETLHTDATEQHARIGRLVDGGWKAEKELVQAAAQERAAQLNVQKSKIDLEKAQKQLTTNRKIRVADRLNAEANYEKEKRRLEEEQQELEDMVIKAPVAGIIVYQGMWKGGNGFSKLQEGDQLWDRQKVAEMPDMSAMIAMVQINEMDSAMIKEGQPAEIRLEALPDLLIKGKVTQKATLAEDKGQSELAMFFGGSDTAGLRTFDITVELDEVDPRLRQGMTANVTIIPDSIPDATYVPLESVFGGEKDGEMFVYAKVRNRFEKRRVEAGTSNDNHIIIKSGVEPGDIVALKEPVPPS
jgi:multidrug efflux pump subunit AcrA (membrane-fusion protein)